MIKFVKIIIFVAIILVVGVNLTSTIKTQEIPKIIINEFEPNPAGSDTGFEWVELLNLTDEEINLQGWKITSTSTSGSYRESIFPVSTILPNSYLIIQENLVNYSASNKVILAAGELNLFNSGINVKLLDSQSRIIDSVNYTAGTEGKSWERKGPLCIDAIQHSSSNSIGTENSDIDQACWANINPYYISNIEFSLDEVNFTPTVETVTETEVFIDYQTNILEEEIQSTKYFLENGSEVIEPLNLNYYFGKIRVQITTVDNTVVEGVSEPIKIHPKLSFNEIYFEDNNIFVEIYNPNAINIDFSNYSLTLNDDELDDISQNQCTSIVQNSYCVVQSIFNPIETYQLKINVNEDLVDYLEISNLQTANSFSKLDNTWIWNPNVTLGQENSLESSTKIIISELLPSPESGGQEWIELYNFGSSNINLKNWYFTEELIDQKCKLNTTFSSIDKFIGSGEHFVISQNSLKVTLNNSSDEIYLCNQQNNIIDKIIYTSSQKNIAYAKAYSGGTYSNDFSLTSILTPGEYNQFPITSAENIISIADLKTKSIGSEFSIQGVVTSNLNALGESIFYIQDQTAGIRIDLDNSLSVEILENDYLKVKGKVATYRNEIELDVSKESDIQKISDLGFTFEPASLSSDLENQEGSLVKVSGEIVNNYSTSFDVKTANQTIRNSILSSTGMTVIKSKGDTAEVIGILSQYDDLYRVLPRKQSDVKIISIKSSTSNKTSSKSVTDKSSGINTNGSVAGESKASYKLPKMQIQYLRKPDRESANIFYWKIFLLLAIIFFVVALWIAEVPKRLWVRYKAFNEKLNSEAEFEYFSTRR